MFTFSCQGLCTTKLEENRSYTYYSTEKLFSPQNIPQQTLKEAKFEPKPCSAHLSCDTWPNECCFSRRLCCEIDTQTCCPQFSSLRRWEISHFLFHVIWIAQKCCQRMLSVKWLQTLIVLNCAPYLTCFSSESTWLNALPDDWLVSFLGSLTIISEVFFCDAKLNF